MKSVVYSWKQQNESANLHVETKRGDISPISFSAFYVHKDSDEHQAMKYVNDCSANSTISKLVWL